MNKLKKQLTTSLAAGALAVAMVGLSAGGAQAATFTGASLSWKADGEILTVKDTKSDGRYIYPMGMYKGTNTYMTPHCSTKGKSTRTCNYSVAECRKIEFWVYSVKGSDMRKLGEFTVTA